MKTFEQLTAMQQSQAYEFAKRLLHETLTNGLTVSDGPLTEERFEELYASAAEFGTYDDDGKPMVDGPVVPYFYQGGCF